MRIWLAIALVAGLGALLAATLRVDTDARGLLGRDDQVAAILDTPEGRLATLAIIAPDRDRRSALAAEIAADLAADPMVARVVTGRVAPPAGVIDWIWRHRFVLAPPSGADFEPENLAAEMGQARAALTSATGGLLADRYLLDPTGSFRRLVAAISAPDPATPARYNGIPQAHDDTAALVFLSLADAPFDALAQAVFDDRLRARVEEAGAEGLVVGPRPLSAQISAQISSCSKLAALFACGLLLVWLAAVLRAAGSLLLCIAPLAIGFLSAALAVQFAFGGVHVIALGFGGALMGMAMDYPIHLLAHRGRPPGLARARRYVGLCVATTAIAFLALIGSGVSALVQVGVFVAIGLVAAGAAAIGLIGGGRAAAAGMSPPVARPLTAPWKLPVLTALVLVSGVALWMLPDRAPQRLIEPPAEVVDELTRIGRMVDLPAGRYRIEVTGTTLTEVLERQAALGAVLNVAIRDGAVGRAGMLAAHLPPRPVAVELPAPEALAPRLPDALASAGLAPGFAARIVDAYAAARDLAPPSAEALAPLSQMSELATLVSPDGGQIRAPVRLWGLSDPAHLADAVGQAAIPGVTFVDVEGAAAESLDALTRATATWMAVGAAAGSVFLFLALPSASVAGEIVLACLAAGLVTAAAASLLAGGLGLFHIVALALVIGIGIDYGLFLTLSDTGDEFAAALRSVLVCAVSTLIAFLTMALSGVNVLEDIGSTLCIGVLAMLAVHLLRRGPARAGAR